ncbi:MAG: O-antigen ligase family protein [Planctomycetota bacterium]
MSPWFWFIGWSFVTIAWSPLTTVSFAQWLGLLALLLMAQAIRDRLRTPVCAHPGAWTAPRLSPHSVVSCLYFITTTYSLAVLVVHFLAPELSGLDRSISIDGSNGLVHPTAAGATGSLGLVLVLNRFFHHRQGASAGTAVALLIHLGILVLSNSRSALATIAAVSMIFFIWATTKPTKATAMVLLGVFCFAILVLDPGLELINIVFGDVSSYIQRGQSIDQLKAVSGRSEIWAAVWEQYLDAPIVGHGYFVTSADGQLDVWDGPANHDAHNVALQVLVSTGLIGMLLFSWSVLAAWIHTVKLMWSHKDFTEGMEKVPFFLLVVSAWFAIWSQGCVTFLGPIRPESVVFFCLLGVTLGLQRSTDLGWRGGEVE